MNLPNERQHEDAIAAEERWLAGFAAPAASPAAIARAKEAIRRELLRSRVGGAAGSLRAWHGAVAAAAMILLAVGVGWHSTRTYVTTGFPADRADSILVAVDPDRPDLSAVVSIDQGLSVLESWSRDRAWDIQINEVYDNVYGAINGNTERANSSGSM